MFVMKFKYYDPELEVRETELEFHPKQKLYYRPNTSDKEMIKEGTSDYPTIKFDGKVVMDCGANIGSFTARALREGAARVVAYEPEDFNFAVLNHNINCIELYSQYVELKKLALVNSDTEQITFYLNKSKNSACSGTTQPGRKKKLELTVDAINFYNELDRIKPSLVKIDIEGGEYDLLEGFVWPDYVKEVALELHGFTNENNKKMYELDTFMSNQFSEKPFFDVVTVFKQPRLILAHYKRA